MRDFLALWTVPVVLAVTLLGCEGGATHGARSTGPASAAAAPTGPVSLTSRTVPVSLPAPGSAGSARWVVQMVVPYGAAPGLLGQADSHGGRAQPVGPEYGAPAADGSWWFLDLNKRRLAHYSRSGRFLLAVPIPGKYVGLQSLHVLADGSMWAQNGTSADDSMVSDGVTARRVDVAGAGDRIWTYDDGQKIYALARRPGPPVATIQIIRGGPVLGQTDAVRSPAGQRFAAYLEDPNAGGPLIIELPDAPHPLRLVVPYRSVATPAEHVGAVVEAETAADGTLYLLLAGSTSGPHSADVAGFVTVTPDGEVSRVLAVPALTSSADPGGAAHLHIDPVTNRPSLVVVGHDALRVYRLDR